MDDMVFNHFPGIPLLPGEKDVLPLEYHVIGIPFGNPDPAPAGLDVRPAGDSQGGARAYYIVRVGLISPGFPEPDIVGGKNLIEGHSLSLSFGGVHCVQ